MKRFRGLRPPTIIGFAAAILALALSNLVFGLSDLRTAQGWLNDFSPWVPWNRDLTIIAILCQFTISLISLIYIYFFRAGFARWLVLVLGGIKFFISLFQLFVALWFNDKVLVNLIEPLLLGIVIGLLLTPSARGWLKARTDADAEIFA